MKYSDAGVNIDRAEVFKNKLKKLVRATYDKNVLSDIGLFGGLYSIGKNTVLVSSIDGVGTKTKIANLMNKHESIGYDIVSHGSNDIVVQGARPLFFLDYIGTGKLDSKIALQLIKGMVKACKDVGCALIGGETAQMPDVYMGNEYDLAGCMVGVVDKKRIIDGKKIKAGDLIIGLKSSGLHTNGYSLARKALLLKYDVKDYIPFLKSNIGDALLKPHISYSNLILDLMNKIEINGLAHITGGGFTDNIPRVLPKGTKAVIKRVRGRCPHYLI